MGWGEPHHPVHPVCLACPPLSPEDREAAVAEFERRRNPQPTDPEEGEA